MCGDHRASAHRCCDSPQMSGLLAIGHGPQAIRSPLCNCKITEAAGMALPLRGLCMNHDLGAELLEGQSPQLACSLPAAGRPRPP